MAVSAVKIDVQYVQFQRNMSRCMSTIYDSPIPCSRFLLMCLLEKVAVFDVIWLRKITLVLEVTPAKLLQ